MYIDIATATSMGLDNTTSYDQVFVIMKTPLAKNHLPDISSKANFIWLWIIKANSYYFL